MTMEWAAVDHLIRELGSVRHAANALQGSDAVQAVVDQAIADAAEAINHTIGSPESPERLRTATDAVGVAQEVILALDAKIGRSLRVRTRADGLRARAAELIRRAVAREHRRSS